jgi:dipeptidyl aminopeptidase/acylaminoacyl peptidase
MSKVKRQYGTWSSPLDVPTLAAQKRLSDVQWDTTSSTLVWSESRGKHGALVAQNGVDAPRDLTPLSVRGRVGYGGGDFTVHEGTVYFVSDGRIFKLSLDGGGATDITSAFGGAAAPTVSPDGKWLVFVHTYQDDDVLALVDTDGKMWSRKLASGTDFAMQPVWQPDGNQIAYIVWDHPNMPWDHTELRLLTLDTDGSGVPYVTRVDTLAHNASIMQPEFSPDGRYLSYVSDQSGFWQIYLHDLSNGETKMLTGPESGLNTESAYNENYNIPSEQGAPGWIQGMRVYGWQADSRHLYFLRNQEGFISLWQCDIREMTTTQTGIFAEYTSISQITVASSGAVAALVSASRIPERVVSFTSPAPSMPSISMPDTPSISSWEVES